MATKYIVNNVSGQTILNGIVISGGTSILSTPPTSITGTTGDTIGKLAFDSNYLYYCAEDFVAPGSGNIWKTVKLDETLNTTRTYKALLTQTGSIVGNNLNDFYDGLIIGETYTITNYVEDADFSNIADVQSGTINQTGCVFIATGEIPNSWNDNSQLTSDGGLVVNVLENTLGYDLIWDSGLFGNGVYYAANGTTGPIRNSFPRNYVDINVQPTPAFYGYEFSLTTINATPASIMEKDDIIFMSVYDANIGDFGYDNLYYTPIEINIKVNITPVVIIPTLNNSYPFYNASFYLGCNGNTNSYFSNDGTTVNNAQELSAVLNNSSETNFLGTFSDDGSGNIILTMTTSVKQQYCEDGSLTIEIFQD